jgi:DNA-binding GntR family transcriptional regulator
VNISMSKKNKSEFSYQTIRKQLMARNVEPGTRLTEQKWSDQLGVNRGDIRQALARLEAEGLVVRGAKGGYFSRRYSPEEIGQANEARMILETGAAKLAVSRATKEDFEELEEICRHMELMTQNRYEMGFSEADVRFHEVLVRAAHNPKLMQIYRNASIPITHKNMSTPEELAETLENNLADHRDMLKALRDGDAERLIMLLVRGVEMEQAAQQFDKQGCIE